MIYEMQMFGCNCDGYDCEAFWEDPETSSIAHTDADITKQEAQACDWHFTDAGKAYCPDCWKMDGDDVIILNDGILPWVKEGGQDD